ncbi:MAG: GAF domain-containing protein [Spirochaetes bacterium]|nr:MAG: GAF domain-containing protein [Spirochaetota bacterium]
MTNLTNRIINERYLVEDLIGEGGMSVVYRARAVDNPGRLYAIKIVRDADCSHRIEDVIRFHAEARLVARVSHPGIVKVVEVGEISLDGVTGVPYIVMEYIDGENLHALIKEGARFSVDETLHIVSHLCEALAHVHELGVVHRDLSPGNVMLAADGAGGRRAMLIDFGLAHVREFSESGREAVIGTFSYMSPEQSGMMRRGVDERSDLYSLGVLMYRLLAGMLPFSANDVSSLIHLHIAQPPEPPSRRAPGIPMVVERIVLKLLEKEPENRYQSARGLQRDVLRALSGDRDFIPGSDDRLERLNFRTNLVGREAELARLKTRWNDLLRGRGSICLIGGEAGRGKTRLAEELRALVIAGGGTFAEGKCFASENKNPYGPIIDAENVFFNKFARMSPAEKDAVSERVRARCGDLMGLALRLNPLAREITGDTPSPVELDPERENRRFLMVNAGFILALAGTNAPLVIFLDDLQWSDEGSFSLLDEIASSIAHAPVMIVGAFRDNETGDDHGVQRLIRSARDSGRPLELMSLPPFDRESVAAFIAGLLYEERDQVGQIADIVYNKSMGNPFFAVEILKQLVQDGALSLVNGSWRANEARLRRVNISSTMLDTVMKRIDGLSARENQVLSCAAVIGRRFDIRLLFELLVGGSGAGEGFTHDEVVHIVDRAVAMQLLEADAQEKGKLFFVHDRIKEAFYNRIGEERRRALHLEIARTLERGGEHSAFDLVHHFTQAGDGEGVLRYALPAGKNAMASFANEDAIGYFAAMMKILEAEGGFESAHARTGPLLRECMKMTGELFLVTGRNDDVIALYTRLLPHLAAEQEKAWAYRQISYAYFKKGDFANSEKFGAQGLSLLGETLPLSMPAVIAGIFREFAVHLLLRLFPPAYRARRRPENLRLKLVIQFYHTLGWNYALSSLLKFVRSTLRMLNISEKSIGTSRELAISLLGLGMMYSAAPVRGLAMIYLKRGLDIARKIEDALYIAISKQLIGTHYSWAGDMEQSADWLGRAYADFRRIGDLWETGQTCNIMSVNQYYMSRYEECEKSLYEWIDISTKIRNDFGLSNAFANLVWVYVESGDYARAREYGQRAMELSRSQGIWFAHFLASAYMGYFYTETGDHVRALRMTEAARGLDRRHKFTLRVYAAPLYVYRAEALLRAYEDEHAAMEEGERGRRLAEIRAACAEAWKACRSWPAHLGPALRVRARFQALAGRPARAERLYRRAVEECSRAGRRFELAKTLLEFGLVLRVSGDRGKAAGRLESALRLFREIAARQYERKAAESAGAAAEERGPMQRLTDRQRLSSIIRISQDMSSILRLDVLLEHVMARAIEVTGAQRGYLFMHNERTGAIELRAAKNIGESGIPEYSQHIIEDVFRRGRAMITTNAGEDEALTEFRSVRDYGLKSILCIPVSRGERMIGVCYLDNPLSTGVFTDDDADLLSVFMTQAAISIENAGLYANLEEKVAERTLTIESQKQELENQITLAQKIQTALLPQKIPRIPGAELAFTYAPMMGVGGDFLDVLYDARRGLLGLFICDVSGHGVPAALLASMVKMSLHTWSDTLDSPAATLRSIQQALEGKMGSNFITACAGCLDLKSGKLALCSAGHPRPILVRRGGSLEIVQLKGRLILEDLKPEFDDRTILLERGDKLILYTDGITEARNENLVMMGDDAFFEMAGSLSGESPSRMCEGIYAQVREYTGEGRQIEDDLTILIVEFRAK